MKRYSEDIIFVAKDLRSQGYTYHEIYDYLGEKIPKSTLSSWFKNISLPVEYYQRMKICGYANIKLAQQHNKKQLDLRLHQLRTKNLDLNRQIDLSTGKIILSVLYWCEGNKYPASKCLRFCNSDPRMITLFITLLRLCYQINESKFRMTIQCRSDQNQIELSSFWQKITSIQPSQQYKPRVDSRSIGKSTLKSNYHGVCVIDYFDTNLQCELQFTGESLGSDISINLMKNQIK